MTSAHFQDFAPEILAAPPTTYLDVYEKGSGRWFVCDAGIVWTDDDSLLGLETKDATSWDLVAQIRAALASMYAQGFSATQAFNSLQGQLDPPEWLEGDLSVVVSAPAEG